ncbi:hypothetical protein ACH5Y9_06745 [Methylomonas sp. BW4-1]|uniref:hypothetical protein n=1 Tax=Methylomonas sp. BW4-1 TaxID=3376685 RepID=UPI0040432B30
MKNNTYYVTSMFISALLSIYSQNSQSNTNQTENTFIPQATTDLRTISHKEAQGCIQSQGNSAIYNTRTLSPADGNPQNGKLCSPSMVKYDISKTDSAQTISAQAAPAPLYLASDCNVVYSGGDQYENCIDNER